MLADSEDVFMLHQPDLKKGRTKIIEPKEDPLIKIGLGDAAKIKKL